MQAGRRLLQRWTVISLRNLLVRLQSRRVRIIFALIGLLGCSVGGGLVLPGQTYDFVFHNWVIDPSGSTPAAGYNFDGLYSNGSPGSGCGVLDRVSAFDPDQGNCANPMLGCIPGVDNMLPRLTDAIDAELTGIDIPVRTRLANEITRGHLILLLRLEGVDSLVNDPDIRVSLYHGYSVNTPCTMMFTGAGKFYVATDSLAVPDQIDQPIWQADGTVVNGRLRVRWGNNSALAWEAPLGFPLSQLSVRVDLAGNGAGGTSGNLGGWLLGSTLRDIATFVFPRLGTMLNDEIPRADDLPDVTSGACGGSLGFPRGGAAVGLRFELAPATILGVASHQPANSCGAQ